MLFAVHPTFPECSQPLSLVAVNPLKPWFCNALEIGTAGKGIGSGCLATSPRCYTILHLTGFLLHPSNFYLFCGPESICVSRYFTWLKKSNLISRCAVWRTHVSTCRNGLNTWFPEVSWFSWASDHIVLLIFDFFFFCSPAPSFSSCAVSSFSFFVSFHFPRFAHADAPRLCSPCSSFISFVANNLT